MLSRKTKRVIALSEALAEHRVLHLNKAASILGVSLMTVRRDINDNPDMFSYLGGHIVLTSSIEGDGPYDVQKAKDSHAPAKRAACSHAVKYIHSDETIFFDCGTTLEPLIDLIPDNIQITAVCYALNIANKLSRKSNVRLIMLGGIYYNSSDSFAPHGDENMFAKIGVNTAFLTAAGIDPERGATCENFHESSVKRQAIQAAQQSVLVTDNSKVGRVKAAHFCDYETLDTIITEDGEVDLSKSERPDRE